MMQADGSDGVEADSSDDDDSSGKGNSAEEDSSDALPLGMKEDDAVNMAAEMSPAEYDAELHFLVHDTHLPVDDSYQAQAQQAIDAIGPPQCRGLEPPAEAGSPSAELAALAAFDPDSDSDSEEWPTYVAPKHASAADFLSRRSSLDILLIPPPLVNAVIPTADGLVSNARLNSGEGVDEGVDEGENHTANPNVRDPKVRTVLDDNMVFRFQDPLDDSGATGVDDGNDHEANPNARGRTNMWGSSSPLCTLLWDGDSSDESEPPDPPDPLKGADPLQAAKRGTPMTSDRANDSDRRQVKYVELDNGTPSLDPASVAARDQQRYGWNAMRWREAQRRVVQDQAIMNQWDMSSRVAKVTNDLECIHISAWTESDQVAGSTLHKEQVHALIRGMDPGVGLTDEVKETKTRRSPDGDHENRCQ